MFDSLLFLASLYWSDGDSGRLPDGTRFRLVNVDAPETYRPKCERERALGYTAKAAAVALTADREITWSVHYHDRHGRPVVSLFADGVNVGDALRYDGYLRDWIHDGRGRALTPRPDWCGAGGWWD